MQSGSVIVKELILGLDELLRRYFATDDLSAISTVSMEAGFEQGQVDLGLEQDAGKRFTLWALVDLLGSAPDLDGAFKTEGDGKRHATSWICFRHRNSDKFRNIHG